MSSLAQKVILRVTQDKEEEEEEEVEEEERWGVAVNGLICRAAGSEEEKEETEEEEEEECTKEEAKTFSERASPRLKHPSPTPRQGRRQPRLAASPWPSAPGSV